MNMGRRNQESFFDVVLSSPWPVSAIVAVFFLALGQLIIPWAARGNPVFVSMSLGAKPLITVVAGIFALIALIKWAVAQYKKPSSSNTSSEHGLPPTSYRTGPSARRAPETTSRRTTPPRQEPSLSRAPSVYAAKPGTWSLELLQVVEWKRFEDLCQKFYEAKGIRSACTPLGPDGGIDVRLFQDGSDKATAIVQCKAWGDSYVGVKPIRELLGVMVHEKVEKAFFMTSGKYSEEAKAFAEPNRITLIDGTMFLAMINRLPDEARQSLLDFATAGNFNIPTCPTCGKQMRFIEGKEGKRDFWGCQNFPKCRQKLWARRGANNLPTALYQ